MPIIKEIIIRTIKIMGGINMSKRGNELPIQDVQFIIALNK